MAQVSFDTLKFAKTLKGKGFSTIQAEGLSEEIRKSHEALDLATKRDLDDVGKDLSTEIIGVRNELSAEIAAARKDLSAEMSKQSLRTIGILGGLVAAGFSAIAILADLF